MKTSVTLYSTPENMVQKDLNLICMGSPRGGTSMIAGALLGLGVDMGIDLPVNVEDPSFNIDGKRQNLANFMSDMKAAIQRRVERGALWGWKYPQAVEYLDDIRDLLPNPRLVIVYRDPVPATIRAGKGRQDLHDFDESCYREMDKSIRLYRLNLELARKWKCPTMLVSYERASQRPVELLEELAAFCGIKMPADISKIVSFMTPGEYKNPNELRIMNT
ncbi:sulfotransferase [Tritonibacter mobilis]|uniref:sulfotransferase n=1 Tax=Tritonibacter mobilis TaxID=379347 RepID=UPI001CDA4F79|nr:sulfotransferase [Tritonibacter mobilis]MCA2008852.1 sulfotransferase [Tritonibacter mobilis]